MEPNPERIAYLKKLADPHYYGPEDDGVDLDEIRYNLSLTPLQRLRKGAFIAKGYKEVRERARQLFKPET